MSKELIKEFTNVSNMTIKELESNLKKEMIRFTKEGTQYHKVQALKAELWYREWFKK